MFWSVMHLIRGLSISYVPLFNKISRLCRQLARRGWSIKWGLQLGPNRAWLFTDKSNNFEKWMRSENIMRQVELAVDEWVYAWLVWTSAYLWSPQNYCSLKHAPKEEDQPLPQENNIQFHNSSLMWIVCQCLWSPCPLRISVELGVLFQDDFK